MSMDPELKAKWVEALRSGEYKQCRGKFEFAGKFCCLGVLCIAAGKPTTDEGAGNWEYVRSALGKGFDPHILARMNDGNHGKRFSFAEIADWIEANL